MTVPPKPGFPKKVYLFLILYYTIVDYMYIAPNKKNERVLKTGWLPIKHFNLEHPIVRIVRALFKKRREKIKLKRPRDPSQINRMLGHRAAV